MMKRVEDYTAFRKSPEKDVRREIAEIISFFREEFATTVKIVKISSFRSRRNTESSSSSRDALFFKLNVFCSRPLRGRR